MELVYLWVEDYKNIKKQGFNFSPRFSCEYDEDSKELTIDENDDYIPDFFGKNINVTAIVGKNGSGKSSVLETLYFSSKKFLDKNIMLMIDNDVLIIHAEIDDEKIINKTKLKYTIKQEKSPTVPYMNISHFQNEDIDITDINHISIYRSRMYHLEVDGWDENDIMLRYKNFKTELNYYYIFHQETFKYFEKNFQISKTEYIKIDFLKDNQIKDFFYEYNVEINIIFYLILSNRFCEDFVNSDNAIDEDILSQFLNHYDDTKKTSIDKFLINATTEDNCLYIKLDDNIQLIKDIVSIMMGEEKLNYFELTLLSKNKNRIDLSSGEQILLMYLYILDSQDEIFLIDEIDLYLHPEWQRIFLSLLLKFTDKRHIILSTHSPFLLSDIPKQNIIFLDKDEDGNCKVVDGLKEKKETFGANIHTLLSDSFFMDGGLMGEIAKGKIDEVIDYLNGKDTKIKDDDEAQKLVNIIGEPIVKNQLQRMLDSKRLSKIDVINQKIKDMSYELEILKQHQDKIVQDELRNRGKKQYKQRFEDD